MHDDETRRAESDDDPKKIAEIEEACLMLVRAIIALHGPAYQHRVTIYERQGRLRYWEVTLTGRADDDAHVS
jgi:hypothetical protein